jgi:hypothetical protein
VPSRADLFTTIEKLLKQGGIITVWRGPYFPKDHGDMPEDAYPLAGYMDATKGEKIESSSSSAASGFTHTGEIHIWIWVATGQLPGPLLANPGPYEVLDDLHDAIEDQCSNAYRGDELGGLLTSQISIFPTSWEPGWYSQDTAHIGAILSLGYAMNR